jgi:hypothetical protein
MTKKWSSLEVSSVWSTSKQKTMDDARAHNQRTGQTTAVYKAFVMDRNWRTGKLKRIVKGYVFFTNALVPTGVLRDDLVAIFGEL